MYETLKHWYYTIRLTLSSKPIKIGTHKKHHVFLTKLQVMDIETLLLLDNSTNTIVKTFSTSQAVVSRIRQGKHRFSSNKYKATIRKS